MRAGCAFDWRAVVSVSRERLAFHADEGIGRTEVVVRVGRRMYQTSPQIRVGSAKKLGWGVLVTMICDGTFILTMAPSGRCSRQTPKVATIPSPSANSRVSPLLTSRVDTP